ncbi:MAG TPA: ester cyclase [Candidatus Acidoferrales bacterium]|nr:ester cyclase [Candidatus Acidoferrales bacterium]
MDVRARTLEVNDATYAAWNAHDADAVAAVFDENAVVREVGMQEMKGRDAVRARAAVLLTAFPDLRLERLALVIDGDRHADRWRLSGTHQGELFGMPPTGRRISIEGATFTRLGANGLVIEDVHLSDLAGLTAQLSG